MSPEFIVDAIYKEFSPDGGSIVVICPNEWNAVELQKLIGCKVERDWAWKYDKTSGFISKDDGIIHYRSEGYWSGKRMSCKAIQSFVVKLAANNQVVRGRIWV